MDFKTMARGCPWRVDVRGFWHCKALTGQPNNPSCDVNNCAGLYIADLMFNELRAELLGGKNENATGTAASPGGDKS